MGTNTDQQRLRLNKYDTHLTFFITEITKNVKNVKRHVQHSHDFLDDGLELIIGIFTSWKWSQPYCGRAELPP